jgi:hypothetical protein
VEQGFTEFASDALIDNATSGRAASKVERRIQFRKVLRRAP